MTQQDRIEEAKAIFHLLQNKPFKFMHYWEMLHGERKWLDHIARKRNDGEDEPMKVSTDHANTLTEPAKTPQTHPMGRDSAKKRRSSDSAYSNASSAFFEVMQ
ncbi:hypothetical protein BS78_01G377400 [Paspalum vaginatum]|nr:hypothetical protein BS78_01G377400 [Paspalum vaginatum]